MDAFLSRVPLEGLEQDSSTLPTDVPVDVNLDTVEDSDDELEEGPISQPELEPLPLPETAAKMVARVLANQRQPVAPRQESPMIVDDDEQNSANIQHPVEVSYRFSSAFPSKLFQLPFSLFIRLIM